MGEIFYERLRTRIVRSYAEVAIVPPPVVSYRDTGLGADVEAEKRERRGGCSQPLIAEGRWSTAVCGIFCFGCGVRTAAAAAAVRT